jgi:hypothetical protein
MQLIEDQSDALNANLGGTALGQGTHADTFRLAGVAGSSRDLAWACKVSMRPVRYAAGAPRPSARGLREILTGTDL